MATDQFREIRKARAAGRLKRDKAVARAVLTAVCSAAGLRTADVRRRPKVPRHNLARRAVAVALMERGWREYRVLRVMNLTMTDCGREPEPEMLAAARRAAAMLDDSRKRQVRAVAEAIYKHRDERPRLIREVDRAGIAASELCDAIGIEVGTLHRWRHGDPRGGRAGQPATC